MKIRNLQNCCTFCWHFSKTTELPLSHIFYFRFHLLKCFRLVLHSLLLRCPFMTSKTHLQLFLSTSFERESNLIISLVYNLYFIYIQNMYNLYFLYRIFYILTSNKINSLCYILTICGWSLFKTRITVLDWHFDQMPRRHERIHVEENRGTP